MWYAFSSTYAQCHDHVITGIRVITYYFTGAMEQFARSPSTTATTYIMDTGMSIYIIMC